MLRALNRPWLHFLVLGALLFIGLRWLNPPPRPSVGPLPASQVEVLKRQWFSTTGRLPDPAQIDSMVRAELDREILFREGLELGLHRYDPVVRQRLVRNMHFLRLGEGKSEEELFQDALRMELHLGDEVVKRRLIQVVEQLLLARRPREPVTGADLAAAYAERREELRRPPRYTIDQVFLAREREAEATAVLATIRERQLDPRAALELGSPFLPGYRFVAQSPAQLARHFGAAFVVNFESLQPAAGGWFGPVASTYGTHLVWVESVEPARDATLEEVRDQLRRDLELQRRRLSLQQAVAELRTEYEVLL